MPFVYCTRCGKGALVNLKQLPKECPNPECQSPNWLAAVNPTSVFKLTYNDRLFLRSIRISTDDPDPTKEEAQQT